MFVVVIAVGVVAGYLIGGRLRGITALRLRAMWLVWLAVILAPLMSLPWVKDSSGLDRSWILSATAAIGAFLVINALLQQAGMQIALGLMGLGWLLNWVVLVANGGVPVPHDLLDRPEHGEALFQLAGTHLLPHVPISSSTGLPWLGDVLRVQTSHVIIPFSVGDAMLVLGTILLIALAMRARSPKLARPGTAAPLERCN